MFYKNTCTLKHTSNSLHNKRLHLPPPSWLAPLNVAIELKCTKSFIIAIGGISVLYKIKYPMIASALAIVT